MRSTCGWAWRVLLLVGVLGLTGSPAVAQSKAKPRPGDLTQYIAPDFCAAIVVHPSQILQSPLASAVPLDQASTMAAGTPGKGKAIQIIQLFDPKKIRRVVVLIDPTPMGHEPVSPAVILQFDEDVDSKDLLSQAWKDVESGECAGKTYLKSQSAGDGDVPAAAYVADPRTLLIGPEPTVEKMLTPSDEPRPLLDQLRQCSLKNDIAVEVLAAPLAKSFRETGAKTQQQATMALAALEEVKTASLAVNFTGDTLLRLAIVGAKEGSVDKLHGQFSFLQLMAGQQLQAQKAKPAEGMPPGLGEAVFNLAEQLLKGLDVAKEDDQVVVTLKMPEDFPGLIKKLAEASAQMMIPAGLEGAMPKEKTKE